MADPKAPPSPGSLSGPPLDSTAALIGRVKTGDLGAREQLVARYHPILMRWAHGRLPAGARGLLETGTLMNVLRNELRRSAHDPRQRVTREVADGRQSLLEEMIGKDVIDTYETALATLSPAMQEAVILRLEFGFTHREIGDAIGSPSANAARMLVSRGLVKLSKAMVQHR